MFQTNYISIQISDSTKTKLKESIKDAMKKKLSVIDFSACETALKGIGLIRKNDSLLFSKTDWADTLKKSINGSAATNRTSEDAVTFDLFTSQGLKIDKRLCSNTTTVVDIHLNIDFSNIKKNNTLYDLFDINSEYYHDLCIPMKDNSSVVTIQDRREQFDSLNYTCSGKCKLLRINLTSGYISCNCNSTDTKFEVTTDVGNIVLSVFNESNFLIVNCYNTSLKIVNFIN